MEEREEHDLLADDLEREADRLEEGSDSVGQDIKETREDWEAKKKSEQDAGAAEPDAAAPGGLGEDEDVESDDDSDEQQT